MNARALAGALLLLSACADGPNTITHGTGAADDPRGYVERLGIATWTHTAGFVLVLATEFPGPAAAAGVEPSDHIESVDGQPIKSAAELEKLLRDRPPGYRVTLGIRRWDGAVTLPVTLERSGPKGYLGTQLKTSGGEGLEIEAVPPDSPAGRAGLSAGERLARIDDFPIRTYPDVLQALAVHAPGDEVPVELERSGARRTVKVTLGRRPDPQLVLLPDWNGSKEAEKLTFLVRLKSMAKFGFVPGPEQWVKSVFLPSADPDEIGRRWINYLVPRSLAAGLIAPERLGPGELPEGSTPIDAAHFDRPTSTKWTFSLAGKAYYGVVDTIYRGYLYTTKEGAAPQEEFRRELVLQIYADKPGPGSVPLRVLLLGQRKWTLGNDPWVWRPVESLAFYAERRLWAPRWQVQGNRIHSMELVERPVAPAEIFKLRPFEFVPVEDVTNFLIAWKSTELEKVLRDAKTEELRDDAVRIEQTILEANEAAEKERDEGQRRVERNQDGVEACTRRARCYRSRIEVLKPILASVKEEISNRGK